MGEFSLLQNDHSIPDMPAKKMYPHRRPCCCLSWTTLNWSVPRSSRGREGRPVRPCLISRGCGCPNLSPLRRLPMLRPHVTRHQPKRHLLPAILTLHPSLLPLPVGRALCCHLLPVRHLRLIPCRLARAADHADFLPEIGLQAHPIVQADQGAKCNLET